MLGPVSSIEAALRLLDDETPAVALLDVNLVDGPVTLVAELLRARNVPFVMASAYSRPELIGGDVLAGAPNVGKPTDEHRLVAALEQSLDSSVD